MVDDKIAGDAVGERERIAYLRFVLSRQSHENFLRQIGSRFFTAQTRRQKSAQFGRMMEVEIEKR